MEYNIESIEDDILTISVLGNDNNYVIWQKELIKHSTEKNPIYFEYNDQSNGGYDNIIKCTMKSDSIRIILTNNVSIQFYFAENFNKFSELKSALKKLYDDNISILDFKL